MTKVSILVKIHNALSENTSSPGLTAKTLARKARTTTENVYRRIYDLKNQHGVEIFTNQRVRSGRKVYYRLAA